VPKIQSIFNVRAGRTLCFKKINSGSFNLTGELISFLWLYSPILGLGRLHKTFRYISVTRRRTVGWTPWTSDQFLARPMLPALGDCDDEEVGGMKRFLA
jgi:hypothetical protein